MIGLKHVTTCMTLVKYELENVCKISTNYCFNLSHNNTKNLTEYRGFVVDKRIEIIINKKYNC